MKKVFLIALPAIVFSHLADCQVKVKNDVSLNHLKGNVKSLISTYYLVEGDTDKIKAPRLDYSSIITFNKKGNILRMMEKKANGSLKYETINKYNTQGKIKLQIGFNKDGRVNYIYKWKYKDHQKLLKRYDAGGNLITTMVSQYDDNGNERGNTGYLPDGNVYYRDESRYDDKNNRIENISYDAKGSATFHVAKKYDSAGNEIESHAFNGDTTSGQYSYRVDMVCKDFVNGIPKEVYLFNPDGTLMRKTVSRFDCDATGNIIKSATFLNDKPIRIQEQKIVYYRD